MLFQPPVIPSRHDPNLRNRLVHSYVPADQKASWLREPTGTFQRVHWNHCEMNVLQDWNFVDVHTNKTISSLCRGGLTLTVLSFVWNVTLYKYAIRTGISSPCGKTFWWTLRYKGLVAAPSGCRELLTSVWGAGTGSHSKEQGLKSWRDGLSWSRWRHGCHMISLIFEFFVCYCHVKICFSIIIRYYDNIIIIIIIIYPVCVTLGHVKASYWLEPWYRWGKMLLFLVLNPDEDLKGRNIFFYSFFLFIFSSLFFELFVPFPLLECLDCLCFLFLLITGSMLTHCILIYRHIYEIICELSPEHYKVDTNKLKLKRTNGS